MKGSYSSHLVVSILRHQAHPEYLGTHVAGRGPRKNMTENFLPPHHHHHLTLPIKSKQTILGGPQHDIKDWQSWATNGCHDPVGKTRITHSPLKYLQVRRHSLRVSNCCGDSGSVLAILWTLHRTTLNITSRIYLLIALWVSLVSVSTHSCSTFLTVPVPLSTKPIGIINASLISH